MARPSGSQEQGKADRQGILKRTLTARAGSLAIGFLSNRREVWDGLRVKAKASAGSKETVQPLWSLSSVLTRNYALTAGFSSSPSRTFPRGGRLSRVAQSGV